MGKFMGELLVPKRGFPPVLVEVAFTVTVDNADFVVSAWLVAVTVAVVVEVTEGAVKSPVLEMVPAEAVHVTAVFVEPLTVAVNCWVLPADSVALVGVIEMETIVGIVGAVALIVQEAVAVLLLLSFMVRVGV
jgi:hypothetical protein